jgi:hypothetical protein
MVTTCGSRTREVFDIIFQVIFIFTFLTVFFFVYVTKIEKEETASQMNFLVDDILPPSQVDSLIPQGLNKKDAMKAQVLISGAIDTAEEQTRVNMKSDIKDINDTNNKTRKKAFKYLTFALSGLVIIVIAFLLVGHCKLGLLDHVRDALWVVLFVALTELTFLQVIAKNYISADPGKVKEEMSAAIDNWVTKENKKK